MWVRVEGNSFLSSTNLGPQLVRLKGWGSLNNWAPEKRKGSLAHMLVRQAREDVGAVVS